MKAVITGSFDPITLGHEDIIARASKMFSSLTVGVCRNSSKPGMLSAEDRLVLVQAACAPYSNVTAVIIDGMVADYCKENGIDIIVRGLRSATDFDYEISLSRINHDLVSSLETVSLACDPKYSHISSNVVREMIRYGHGFTPFVSKEVGNLLKEMIYKKN